MFISKVLGQKWLKFCLCSSHCRILLNRIQLGENPAVSFCFDFYYIKLPQRLELPQIYVFQFFSIIWEQYTSILPELGTSALYDQANYILVYTALLYALLIRYVFWHAVLTSYVNISFYNFYKKKSSATCIAFSHLHVIIGLDLS